MHTALTLCRVGTPVTDVNKVLPQKRKVKKRWMQMSRKKKKIHIAPSPQPKLSRTEKPQSLHDISKEEEELWFLCR